MNIDPIIAAAEKWFSSLWPGLPSEASSSHSLGLGDAFNPDNPNTWPTKLRLYIDSQNSNNVMPQSLWGRLLSGPIVRYLGNEEQNIGERFPHQFSGLRFRPPEVKEVSIPERLSPFSDLFDLDHVASVMGLFGVSETSSNIERACPGSNIHVLESPVWQSPWLHIIQREFADFSKRVSDGIYVRSTYHMVPLIHPYTLLEDQIAGISNPDMDMPKVPIYFQLMAPEELDQTKAALVIIPGMGQDHFSFESMRLKLVKEGVASIVFNYRHTGFSPDFDISRDIVTPLSDIAAVLEFVPQWVFSVFNRELPLSVFGFSAGSSLLTVGLHYPPISELLRHYQAIIPTSLGGYLSRETHEQTAQRALGKGIAISDKIMNREIDLGKLPPPVGATLAITLGSKLRREAQLSLWQTVRYSYEDLPFLNRNWRVRETYQRLVVNKEGAVVTKFRHIPELYKGRIHGFGHTKDPFSATDVLAVDWGDSYTAIGSEDDALSGQQFHEIYNHPMGYSALLARIPGVMIR